MHSQSSKEMSRYEVSKFSPAPDPELICGICMDVLDTPHETPCRHVFCCECIGTAIRENSKCPVCRAPCTEGQSKEVLPLVQNLINKLTMKCDNYDNGCTELIPKEFFLDHIKSCEYVMVQCRYKPCGQYLLKKDCQDHEATICVYRDRACEGGCGLMVPVEKAESHKCIETLLTLVNDLTEKNVELRKKVDELLNQALPIIVKPEPPVPVGGHQDDQTRSFTSDDDSASFSSNSFSQYDLSEVEVNDFEYETYGTGQRRSRRLAALMHDVAHVVEPSDYSNQSQNSQTPENYYHYNDDEHADRSYDDVLTIDWGNNLGIPEYQAAEEIITCSDDSCSGSNNGCVHDSAAATDADLQAPNDNANSLSVLGFSGNVVSSRRNNKVDPACHGKRPHEEISGECGDGSAHYKWKRSLSREYRETKTETAESSSGSNTEQARTHPHVADSLTPSNSETSSVTDESASTSDQASSTTVTHKKHASNPSSSDCTNTLSSTTDTRNVHNASASRHGPVTRSLHDQNVLLEDNVIPYVKVPPTVAYLLNKYAQEDDSSDDESWSPSHEK